MDLYSSNILQKGYDSHFCIWPLSQRWISSFSIIRNRQYKMITI